MLETVCFLRRGNFSLLGTSRSEMYLRALKKKKTKKTNRDTLNLVNSGRTEKQERDEIMVKWL